MSAANGETNGRIVRSMMRFVVEENPETLSPNVQRIFRNLPESLPDLRDAAVARQINEMRMAGKPTHWPALREALPDLAEYIAILSQADAVTDWILENEIEDVWQAFERRKAKRVFDEASFALSESPDKAAIILDRVRSALAALEPDEQEPLSERLQARRFNILVRPPEQPPRFTLAGVGICTAGNLTSFYAPPKGGKSAVIGAAIGAAIGGANAGDCLGFEADNRDGKALIHFDTEQSPEDHYRLIDTAMRRAGARVQPPWLHSYAIKGFSVADARRALVQTMKHARNIFAVLLDGIADYVSDPNDPEESNGFVSELSGLSVEYSCPIIGVIHLNPGTEKTRGHLGSQLERKAETNLRLERDGDAIILWSDKNRRAPILKNHAPRFAWSDEAGMFVSIANAGAAKIEAERPMLVAEVEALFDGKQAMKWGEIIARLMEWRKLSDSGARKRLGKFIGAQVIKREVAGLYVFTP